MEKITEELVRKNVTHELSEALESINGDMGEISNVDLNNMKVTVVFDLNHAPDENYVGLLYW